MERERVVFRKGEKIYLRPVLKEDIDRLIVYINDEETTADLLVRLPMSREVEENWYNSAVSGSDSNITLAIIEISSDILVGVVGMDKINYINGTTSAGIWVCKEVWRKGYASEAGRIVLKYAFETLNLRKITTSALARNQGSIKLHEKLGFEREAVLEKQHYRDGDYIDEIIFKMFREKYFAMKKK